MKKQWKKLVKSFKEDPGFKWATIFILGGSVAWDIFIFIIDGMVWYKPMTMLVFWAIYFIVVIPYKLYSLNKKLE